MIYDVQFFIDKFSSIPEDKWCTGTQQNHCGQRCAYGHVNYGGDIDEYPAFYMLDSKYGKFLPLGNYKGSINKNGIFAEINNGKYTGYPQPTPKQRILAALYDIKKLQTKDIDTGAKRERIVYVAVPETIKEQASELILS